MPAIVALVGFLWKKQLVFLVVTPYSSDYSCLPNICTHKLMQGMGEARFQLTKFGTHLPH